ncbi:MAG: hypothetical protein QOI61_155 [Actinomycetota bacterium]
MALLSDPWSPVEVRQLVEAPRDDVFNFVANPETYPKWLVGAQQIRDVDDDFPEPGAAFEHSVGASPEVSVDDSTVVIEAHGHRQLVLEAHVGPIKAKVEFDFVRRGEQTEIVMRERPMGPAQALTPLIRPMLALRNRVSMQRLARCVAEDQD